MEPPTTSLELSSLTNNTGEHYNAFKEELVTGINNSVTLEGGDSKKRESGKLDCPDSPSTISASVISLPMIMLYKSDSLIFSAIITLGSTPPCGM